MMLYVAVIRLPDHPKLVARIPANGLEEAQDRFRALLTDLGVTTWKDLEECAELVADRRQARRELEGPIKP